MMGFDGGLTGNSEARKSFSALLLRLEFPTIETSVSESAQRLSLACVLGSGLRKCSMQPSVVAEKEEERSRFSLASARTGSTRLADIGRGGTVTLGRAFVLFGLT